MKKFEAPNVEQRAPNVEQVLNLTPEQLQALYELAMDYVSAVPEDISQAA